MAFSYAFASSMKTAIPIAALRHAEIRQHLSLNETVYLQTSQFEALVSPFLTTGRYILRNMLSN
jgi:hypothetical protein